MGDAVPYEGIEANRWLKYAGGVNIYYASTDCLNFAAIKKLILHIRPDYIYLNNMFSQKFTIIPLLLKMLNVVTGSIVLSPRGMLQDGAVRFKPYKKKLYFTALRLLNVPRQITFHATDEQEKQDILKYFPMARQIFIADNLGPVTDIKWAPVPKVCGALKMIFLSRISPKKNLLYVLKLLADFPFKEEIFLDIAGGIEDSVYWEECKTIMQSLPSNIQVNYIGSIRNEKIYGMYSNYHVFILPTLGENFGHAILEALRAGKPVLISDKTPWKNLSEKMIGYDLPLHQPGAFHKAIQKFAAWNQAEYDLWSRAAWLYAKEYMAVSDARAKYMEVFK